MGDEIDMKEYGKLLQQVETLTKTVDELKKLVGEMNILMQQSKGGYKTLVWLGGISGSIGGILAWILAHYKATP